MDKLDVNFMTGSSYQGTFDNVLNRMHGFGEYRYPDGTFYRGYFKNGRFDGFGVLELAAPHNFTIKGVFKNGTCVEYVDMIFEDGVHFTGYCNGKTMDMKNWKYLKDGERRYAVELKDGIPPVLSAEANETAQRPARRIPRDLYDVQEGFYSPHSYAIRNRPPPLSKLSFINNPEERKWIEKNCRKSMKNYEPELETGRNILQNNMDEMAILTNMKRHCCRKGVQEMGNLKVYPIKAKSVDVVSEPESMNCSLQSFAKARNVKKPIKDFKKIIGTKLKETTSRPSSDEADIKKIVKHVN